MDWTGTIERKVIKKEVIKGKFNLLCFLFGHKNIIIKNETVNHIDIWVTKCSRCAEYYEEQRQEYFTLESK